METRDGTTGNSDEEGWEDGIRPLLRLSLSTHIIQMTPQFWQLGPLGKEHHHQRSSHKQQRESEQRIYLTDNLVDRQHGGNDIVAEDNSYPHHSFTTHGMQYLGRRIDKHGAHHDKQ